MWTVRLAKDSEAPAFVEMALASLKETCPSEPFNVEKIRNLFAGYQTAANPTIFFCEKRGVVVGMLAARICEFDYRDGLYTTQRLIYVKPGYRGTRAALMLIRNLIRWSAMLGAERIEGGVDNGFQIETTRRFLEKCGFTVRGYTMVREIPDVEKRRWQHGRCSGGEGG